MHATKRRKVAPQEEQEGWAPAATSQPSFSRFQAKYIPHPHGWASSSSDGSCSSGPLSAPAAHLIEVGAANHSNIQLNSRFGSFPHLKQQQQTPSPSSLENLEPPRHSGAFVGYHIGQEFDEDIIFSANDRSVEAITGAADALTGATVPSKSPIKNDSSTTRASNATMLGSDSLCAIGGQENSAGPQEAHLSEWDRMEMEEIALLEYHTDDQAQKLRGIDEEHRLPADEPDASADFEILLPEDLEAMNEISDEEGEAEAYLTSASASSSLPLPLAASRAVTTVQGSSRMRSRGKHGAEQALALLHSRGDWYGLPSLVGEIYQSRGITSLHAWQKEVLSNPRLLAGCNFLCSQPTSAGKVRLQTK